MGNCLVMQENITKVMRPDGKILEYRADMKVYQVLSEFSGHAISETTPPVYQHLRPDTRLLGGRLYYLVPLPSPPKKASQKKVRFSEPEAEAEQETKVVRIKIVISKKQLQDMLIKGGVSVDDMVTQLQSEKSKDKTNSFTDDGKCEGGNLF